jgi:hypothetical protein
VRLHEKIGLYGLVLPVFGLSALGMCVALFERSTKAAPIRTDVIGPRGRVSLADPVCNCGSSLDPVMKGSSYWEATCPSCGQGWSWGFDFRSTITGRALHEMVAAQKAAAAEKREAPSLAPPVGLDQERGALNGATRSISRIPVTSSALRSVGFDAGSSTLEIEFVSGAVYQYFDVPRSVYLEFLAAPSKGRFFNADIRDAGYRFLRVE